MDIYSSKNTSKVQNSRNPVSCIICRKYIKESKSLWQHYETHTRVYISTSDKFLDNKYTRLYFKILATPDVSGYVEKHHIIPRSLGGNDSKENVIPISARKHFLCHYLLTKMVKKNSAEWHSMVKAFNMMACTGNGHNERYMNSRLFETNRKHLSTALSIASTGKENSQYGTTWIHHIQTGESIKVKIIDLHLYCKKLYKRGRVINVESYLNRLSGKPTKAIKNKKRTTLLDYSLPEKDRLLPDNMVGARKLTKSRLAVSLGYDINGDTDIENIKLRNVLIELYHNQGLSLPQLCARYNAHLNSFEMLMDFCGVRRRPKPGSV